MEPFLSICIPSYNRPDHLLRLLMSIDVSYTKDIEVVICEDKSPGRDIIAKKVEEFKTSSPINCKLFLNEKNLGYDENLKELIRRSSGKYIMYMGDDDVFHIGALNLYIDFLKKNPTLGYILRRYTIVHTDGSLEDFRYFTSNVFFEPGEKAFATLFRKSVFISGFCFRRDYVLPYFDTNEFKSTLLYQLFLCGQLVLEYPSAYCDIPITLMDESERGLPEFGSSVNEAGKYTPGKISIQNSVNFMKSFLIVTAYFDRTANFNATEFFLKDLSKYSYPVLSIQRGNGIRNFLTYNKVLRQEIHINKTYHYYLYFYSLLFFGKRTCDRFISRVKKIVGKTPQL